MNELENNLKDLSNKASIIKDQILNEEATKTSLVLPFFRILGYDIENPQLMIPEYGIEGDRVDYSIMNNGSPLFFIEAKNIKENLDKHKEQIEKYFNNSDIKIICLTNGLKYDFYSDLDKDNKMDDEPFLSFDIENITDFEISHLIKLSSTNFNLENYADIAYQIKATEFIRNQLKDPSEEFIRFIANGVSSKKKTKSFLLKVKELIYRSIQDVLKFFSNGSIIVMSPISNNVKRNNSNIVTTQEELDGYKIIISILSEIYSIDNVNYKDTQSYFAIISDNKPKQWITRLCLGTKKKSIMIPNGNKYDRFYINDIQDLYNYREQILDSASKYLAIKVAVSEPIEQPLLIKPGTEIIEEPRKKKTLLEKLFH